MAVRAYSTLAPIQSRSVAVATPPSLEPDLNGRGCIFLNGSLITFQAGRQANVGERVLVVSHEGRVEIRTVGESWSRAREGFAYVEGDRSLPIGRRGLDLVPLIGAIV